MRNTLALAFAFLALSLPATAATLAVDAKSVIFAAAGNGNPDPAGLVPTTIVLPSGTGRTLTVSMVTGLTSPLQPEPYLGPDGGFFLNVTPKVYGYNGIAGITDHGTENVMALMGVFTAGVPDPALRPAVRDITGEKELPVLNTMLNQPFFVGDGQWSGGFQTFLVPDGATGLTFGFADAIPQENIYQGPPGAYQDNSGALNVTYNVVPEAAPGALMVAGLALATGMRRKNSTV